jgi:hypothetical protein
MSLSSIPNTGVAITNPLVLYRALLATNRITQDPAQHRLGKSIVLLSFTYSYTNIS